MTVILQIEGEVLIEACMEKDIIEEYLANKNIEGLYQFVKGKEVPYVLYNLLEIWALEKTRQEKTVFWDICKMEDVEWKSQIIDKGMILILKKVDLQGKVHGFVCNEISVWTALAWVLTHTTGMVRLDGLAILMDWFKQYHPEDAMVLKAAHEKECKTMLQDLPTNGNGYFKKSILVRVDLEEKQKSLLQVQIEEEIKKENQKIKGRLYAPTNMEKIDEQYYIVDCWHDRVIYSDRLCDIAEWEVVDENLKHPHSICQGMGGYAIENTEKSVICFYQKSDDRLIKTDEIFAGRRPHRILYDAKRDVFWILASRSQEIIGVKLANGCAEKCCQQKIKELQSGYARSMRIIGDMFYIVSSLGVILQLSFLEEQFIVEKSYPVASEFAGMNDIIFFDDFFWISYYQNDLGEVKPGLIKVRQLEDFTTGKYEDVYHSLGMKGVPYYFSWIDGKLCIPEIDTYNRIVLYDVNQGEITVNQVLYDFGEAEQEDIDYMRYS